MSNSRAKISLTLLTAGLGLTTLCYGITQLVQSLKQLKSTNAPADSSASLAHSASDEDNSVRNATSMLTAITNRFNQLISTNRGQALKSFAIGSACFFGAYKAARSVQTGEAIGLVSAAIGAAATVATAATGYKLTRRS